MATKTKDKTRVVTGRRTRLSYVHLHEPYSSIDGQAPKYSVVLLIPKDDEETITAIREAQDEALRNGKTVFKGKAPRNDGFTLRDGDEDDSIDLERNPEYAGHYFMNVSSKTKPGLVDRRLESLTDDPEAIYSGCYARVSIRAFPFNTQGNKGVSFGLNNVQKIADGDYLGGRTRAEDDFDELDDEDDEDGSDVL